MAVPVNTNLFAGRPHNFFDGKFHEVERAIRSSVANRVAEHDGARTISNGGRVEAFHGFGVGANRVLGNIHRRKPILDREPDGFFRRALEVIDGPVFHEAANRAGAEERCGFNGDAHAL